jgi:hypothetical protein
VRADHDRRAAGGQQHRDEAFALAPGQPGEIAQRGPGIDQQRIGARAWVSVRARSIRASRSAGKSRGHGRSRGTDGPVRSARSIRQSSYFQSLCETGKVKGASVPPAPCPRSCPRPAAR